MRWPVSGKQYGAMQALFGVVSTFEVVPETLRDRAEAAGCWEDIQTIRELSGKVMDKILSTVPENKLRHIKAELCNIRIVYKVLPPGLADGAKGYSYTPTETLNDLLNYLVQHECCMCDKTAAESKHCPHRKVIEDALPHEVDGDDREHCKFSDMVLGL